VSDVGQLCGSAELRCGGSRIGDWEGIAGDDPHPLMHKLVRNVRASYRFHIITTGQSNSFTPKFRPPHVSIPYFRSIEPFMSLYPF
jgi:hypothetical protein